MSTRKHKRKLAAILKADVQDYSRLMSEDEAGTIRAAKSYFQAIFETVEKSHGRVVDSAGDQMLAEFASVVDAVQCALEIQRAVAMRNEELPGDRRMVFRIGINLGDVVEEDGRLFGDGVIVASRIEEMAGGGEIFLSGTAYDQVRNKIPAGYEYRGTQPVKNIPDPIRVYRVVPGEAGERVGTPRREWKNRLKVTLLAAVPGVIVAVIATILWRTYWKPPAATQEIVPGTPRAMALPEGPSLAVLPFENMSGDPDQEFLADGLTDDIITSLSKLPRLFVIARSSTQKYKGKPADVKQISQDLGVRHVLEGSVQKSGKRLRVNAQLIDGTTGSHVWSERYDRDMKDFFQTRDEIILEVASSLAGELLDAEFAKIVRKRVKSLEAWEAFQRGQADYERSGVEDQIKARAWYRKVTELEPESVLGWMGIAWATWKEGRARMGPEGKEMFRKAVEMAEKVRRMDPTFHSSYMLLSNVQIREGRYEEAVANARKCYELEPTYVQAIASLAHVLTYAGREEAEEAIGLYEKAMRINPDFRPWYPHGLGKAYLLTGQTDKAIEMFRVAAKKDPKGTGPCVDLAAVYADLGREEEMHAEAAEILRRMPAFTVSRYMKTGSFPRDPEFKRHQREMLLKAGLPE